VPKGGEIKMTITIIGGLKGPFTPVPEEWGHGYLGAILYDNVEDKIQCHACGGWFRQISTGHLRSANCSGLMSNLNEYKREYGFPKSLALQAEGTREKRIEMAKRHIQAGTFKPFKEGEVRTKAMSAKAIAIKHGDRKNGPKERSRRKQQQLSGESPRLSSQWTIFDDNKKIRCAWQLEDELRQYIQEDGRIAKKEELPIWLTGILQYRYGSFNKALVALNIEGRAKGKRYSVAWLLQQLRRFQEEYGRPPVASDTRLGMFPACTTYANYFGSWSNAKKLAGV